MPKSKRQSKQPDADSGGRLASFERTPSPEEVAATARQLAKAAAQAAAAAEIAAVDRKLELLTTKIRRIVEREANQAQKAPAARSR